MNMLIRTKIKIYYTTAIFSLLFAVIGFTYNAWRMEISEDNDNIRTASFEVLKQLAELEANIFAAHYDQDPVNGNPRAGWVKVGLIVDLSTLINSQVARKASTLKQQWEKDWQTVPHDRNTTQALVLLIDETRHEIKQALAQLP